MPRAIILLFVLFGPFVLVPPAGAQPTPATLQSEQATVTYTIAGPDACLSTSLQIYATEDTRHEAGAEPRSTALASATLTRYNVCAPSPTLLVNAQGFMPLPPGFFTTKPELQGATLTASFYLYDWVSGVNLFLDMALEWVGVGPMGDSHTYELQNQEIQNNRFRFAEMQGTLSLAGGEALGIDVADRAVLYAQLGSINKIDKR